MRNLDLINVTMYFVMSNHGVRACSNRVHLGWKDEFTAFRWLQLQN